MALARALVNRPRLLLLDEPLSALDANLRLEMQRELKVLQREVGITFIFVTHDQSEALAISDRVVLLRHGKVNSAARPALSTQRRGRRMRLRSWARAISFRGRFGTAWRTAPIFLYRSRWQTARSRFHSVRMYRSCNRDCADE